MANERKRVNKYPGPCHYCKGTVPANGGRLWKVGRRWAIAHLDCDDAGEPRVVTFHSPTTGWSGTQNYRGRCEDAPCCGCCTC